MAKPDFPPLLQPGMHRLNVHDLYALAVLPFAEHPRRQNLHDKLCAWIGALQALSVGGTLWLDGSFLTEKSVPGDIDCVLWRPCWRTEDNVTPAMESQVARLLDHATAENIYCLDLYVEAPSGDEIFHREAYWRGVLGFSHDRVTAKGFAEVIL